MEGEITLHSSYVRLINSGETVTDHQKRLTVFQGLASMFSLIPLKADTKKCFEDGWQHWCLEKRPFKDEDFIHKNAGVACGPASGVIVIDIDNEERTRRWLERNKVSLPDTFTVKTNKGRHLYLAYPKDGEIYTTRQYKENGKMIFEIRAVGSYVTAPGSIHPDSGKAYTIEKNIPLVTAHGWIIEELKRNIKSETENNEVQDSFIDDENEVVENINLNSSQLNIDIFTLPIPDITKAKILNHYAKGSRSEHEMEVINSLVKAKISDEVILGVFEKYPIGDKYREYGDGRFKRMTMQLDKAREFIGANNTIEADVFSLKTAGQIRASKKKVEFIMEPILAERDSLIILGKGGVGKSLLVLYLIITLAMSSVRKFLELERSDKQFRTLIFQSENSESCVSERFKDMFGEDEIPQSVLDNVIFTSENDDILVNGDLNEVKFYEKVTRTIESCKPDIIVFDPLISFYIGDENHNNGMRKVLDIISRIMREQNVAAIVIHHDGKGTNNADSGGRGASAIGDWTANSLKLTETKEQGFLQLNHVKCRYRRPLEPMNIIRTDSLRFEIVESGQDSSTNSNSDIIIEAVNNLGGTFTVKSTLVKEVNKILKESNQVEKAYNTITKMLDGLVAKNIISLDDKTYRIK